MENGHLHDDKLFRAVHDRLSDYEAPSEGANWDAMSRALDNLPKSSGFRWKISLNSILLIVGIVGISAISYAVVSHTGNSSDKKATPEAPVVKQEIKQDPVIPVSNPAPSNTVADPNAFANANSLVLTQVNSNDGQQVQSNTVAPAENTQAPNTNPDGTKKRRKNQLIFGDQIDPKKGFIYGTHESPAITTANVVDPVPNVFYDADQDGNVKKIIIKKDSASSSKSGAAQKPDAKPEGAPTNGEQRGFGVDGN